jgi:hypothetical protein
VKQTHAGNSSVQSTEPLPMTALLTPLPLLPTNLLRRHQCAEPQDTRFRSVARLRQSLWREQHGYACGRYVHPDGRTCRLGSNGAP